MSTLYTQENSNKHSILNDKKFLTKENTQASSNRSLNNSNLKFYEIKNIYNKLDYEKLKGIKRFENFPVFTARERDVKTKKKLILRVKKDDFSLKKNNSYFSSKNSIYITQNSSIEELSHFPSIFDKIDNKVNSQKDKRILNYKNQYNLIFQNNNDISKKEKTPIRNIFLHKLKNLFGKNGGIKTNKSANFLFNKKLYELNRFRTCENSPSTHIKKLNECLNKKKIYNLKQERFQRLQEYKRNQLESVDDKIGFLHKSQMLLDNKYIINCKKYISSLYKEMDKQDNNDNIICDKINKLKIRIYHLNKKIYKLLKEKNTYIKWMIFQVQIKEKIIRIPKNYEELLKIGSGTKLPEQLLKYKKEIIFPSPDDLIDELKIYENNNIKLMEMYILANKALFPLKKKLEKELLIRQKKIDMGEFNELCLEKEKIKTQNDILINKLFTLKNEAKLSNVNSRRKENLSEIYNKLKIIINNIFGNEIIIKKSFYIEKEILSMLKEIEIRFDKEKDWFLHIEKNEQQKLKLLKAKMIKDSIKEKIAINKNLLIEKKNLQNKRILEKSNRPIILPTIRINWDVYKMRKKMNFLFNNSKNNKDEESLETNFDYFNYDH